MPDKYSCCPIPLPAGLDKAHVTRCRFAKQGTPYLFVVINVSRSSSYLAVYGPEQHEGGAWVLLKKLKVDSGPNAALEISKSGHLLALGQTSGKLLVSG